MVFWTISPGPHHGDPVARRGLAAVAAHAVRGAGLSGGACRAGGRQSDAVAARPPALSPPAAERRHLTVLCCDLAGAIALAERPDPEEYREVLQAYHQTCTEVIQRFDGYVAQYLGNGVLVYFGYPV